MLLVTFSKEEFLTCLDSFVTSLQNCASHLEAPTWPNIGYGCVPSLAGSGEGNAWILGFRKTPKMGIFLHVERGFSCCVVKWPPIHSKESRFYLAAGGGQEHFLAGKGTQSMFCGKISLVAVFDLVGFPCVSVVKNSPCNTGDTGLIPQLEGSPGGGYGSPNLVFLPGESPWTEEPGELQSVGWQRVRHD